MTTNRTQINVRATDRTISQLNEICTMKEISRSEAVRQAVDALFIQMDSEPVPAVSSPTTITVSRRNKFGFDYTASQPLETPTEPYYTGTWHTVSVAIDKDRTLASFRSGGTYYRSAWFVRYQGKWWRICHDTEMTPGDLNFCDQVQLKIERV